EIEVGFQLQAQVQRDRLGTGGDQLVARLLDPALQGDRAHLLHAVVHGTGIRRRTGHTDAATGQTDRLLVDGAAGLRLDRSTAEQQGGEQVKTQGKGNEHATSSGWGGGTIATCRSHAKGARSPVALRPAERGRLTDLAAS